ncbi:WbuC family cupin fold metalloprotein [uncultured Bacteroides sp.]|uniref:WbuC family cupin fold metalloprotein n=1 Tax=uncultured Bacteroides sp. TaxID=162156 RepID=UPI00374A37C6
MQIDKELIMDLFDKAVVSERKRMYYDLRTSSSDGSQRMLNALMPGTDVPIHRHPQSNENVICLCGKLVEVLYEEDSLGDTMPMRMDAQDVPNGKRLKESARYMLDPSVGNFGCVIPAGVWHTVEVIEPCVIYEAKDGKYGEDGSETNEK